MKGLVVGVVLALVIVPSAQAGELRLRRLASSDAPPVAAGKAGELAYLGSPTVLTVRKTGKPTRTFAVPAGCVPQAAGSGVVALGCRLAPTRAVLIADGGAVVPFSPPGSTAISYGDVRAIGTHWLIENTSSFPDMLHLLESQALIEWRTGRTLNLGAADPFGKHKYLDLDSAEPARRLCAPVTRARGYKAFSDVRFANVGQIGSWVLQTGSALRLQRCGQRKTQQYDSGSRPVLGRDAIGYLQGRRIIYRDLRSDRRWTTPWPTSRRPFLTMFGRRLIVSTQGGTLRYTIYQASR